MDTYHAPMNEVYHKVIDEYDSSHDYGIHIQNRYQNCLSLLRKDDVFSSKEFLQKNQDTMGVRKQLSMHSAKVILNVSLKIGRQIGLIKVIDAKHPISFIDFCNLQTVSYYAEQLRGSKLQNLRKSNSWKQTTRGSYLYKLWNFNNWLVEKPFEFSKVRYIDNDTFRKEKTTVKLTGVEHFLKLFQDSMNSDSEFIKMIKRYLMDKELHQDASVKYMRQKHIAITSYFEKNDSPLKFRYDPNALYDDVESVEKKITLEDLVNMLTTGKASLLDRAVVLCKFHRGLDILTLIDRFNFQAWGQLVNYFGTEIFEKWDLSKCPVPITLTRIKTGYKHRGFLDLDAIVSLQNYLKFRYEQTGKPLEEGEAMFLTSRKKPISHNWVMELIPRLAKNAGIQNKIPYKSRKINEKTSHELRDLLKSTLITCDASQYVCELAIGHKVGDSYEKQDKLYPEKTREEYMKASSKLNIISKITNAINETDSSKELQTKLDKIQDKSDLSNFKNEQMITSLLKTQEKLVLQMDMIQKSIPVTKITS